MRESRTRPLTPKPVLLAGILAAILALASGAELSAQAAAEPAAEGAPAAGSAASDSGPGAQASGSEDEMFGSPETVTQANNVSKEASGQSDFLKYDQVKVGGLVTSKASFYSVWSPAWDGSAKAFDPTKYYISPDLEGRVTLVAKPSSDFGVDMDFRTSWPFSATETLGSGTSGLQNNPYTHDADESKASFSIPQINVWALYSKFNWMDKVYFSFGKQPLSWGVSKTYFQPADDIFAVSTVIDPTDTSAEREGPVSLKMTLPLGVTNNLYFFAGLPSNSSGSATIDPADARLAVKGEYGFGNTELALGAFYAYNDYPRALLMGTTGVGPWNFFGEAVLKYGSERYFLSKNAYGVIAGDQSSGKLYFAGTAGGYYTNADAYLTISLAYMYNGEAQGGVSAQEALKYYTEYSSRVDRSKFGAHYAFASVSKTDILPDLLGSDKLGVSLIAISNLSDLSGIVIPSLTWSFFSYMSLQLGADFNFGPAGSEYIVYGVGGASGDKPGAALFLTLTAGTGAF